MPIPFILGVLAAGIGSTAAATAAGTVAAAAGVTATTAAGVAAGTIGAATTAAALAHNKENKNGDPNQPAVPVKEIFTTDEAMKVLGMSKPTILKKMKDGLIPYEGSGGRGGFRIRREALEAYAKKNNIVPNWVVETNQGIDVPDKEELEEIIKYKKLEKDELELELEELELLADDTIEHKRNVIQLKKKIKGIDKDIQETKMFLMGINAMESKEK